MPAPTSAPCVLSSPSWTVVGSCLRRDGDARPAAPPGYSCARLRAGDHRDQGLGAPPACQFAPSQYERPVAGARRIAGRTPWIGRLLDVILRCLPDRAGAGGFG